MYSLDVIYFLFCRVIVLTGSISKSHTSRTVLFRHKARDFGSLFISSNNLRYAQTLLFFCLNNRGWPIRVAGVVVVDVAAGVHIPGVVRVVAIRRTQTDILRYSLVPNFVNSYRIFSHLSDATFPAASLFRITFRSSNLPSFL